MTADEAPYLSELKERPDGAYLRPSYMTRSPKVYAIYESEMETLSTLNGVATAAFSLAGSFASFAIGLFVQDALAPSSTPLGKAIVSLGIPAGMLLAFACLAVAFLARHKRGGALAAIRNESRTFPQQ